MTNIFATGVTTLLNTSLIEAYLIPFSQITKYLDNSSKCQKSPCLSYVWISPLAFLLVSLKGGNLG